MDSQKLDAILGEPLQPLCFCPKMASEAISEYLISKHFLGEHALRLYGYACIHIHTSETHVTPLLKILATGLDLVPFANYAHHKTLYIPATPTTQQTTLVPTTRQPLPAMPSSYKRPQHTQSTLTRHTDSALILYSTACTYQTS